MKCSANIGWAAGQYVRHKYSFIFLTTDYVEAKPRRTFLQNNSPHIAESILQILNDDSIRSCSITGLHNLHVQFYYHRTTVVAVHCYF